VKLLCSAEAMPFELFESVLTHEAYRALEASGSTAASSSSSAAAGPSSHGHGHAHGSAAAWRGAHSGSSGGHGHEHKGGQGELLVDNELGFAKDRTISRLTEMQSLEYLAAHAEAHEPSLMAALREALDKKASAAAAAAGAPRAAAAGQR
jgi:predicted ATPase